MRKIWLIRKDQEAVSPVIATILMVAITVVLAAVLYVMVSGLLGGGSTTGAKSVGLTVTQTGNSWVMLVSSVSASGIALSATTISIFDQNANPTNISNVKLSSIETTAFNGVKYTCKNTPCETDIVVGARLTVNSIWFPANYNYELADTSSILARGTYK